MSNAADPTTNSYEAIRASFVDSLNPRPAKPATTRLKPLHDNIVVRRHEAPSVSRGGLHLPEQAKEKPALAEVLAIGTGRWEGQTFVPITVRVGDTVLLSRYGGSEVEVDGEKVVVVRETELLGVMGEVAK